jgi:adenylylsulfate kinase
MSGGLLWITGLPGVGKTTLAAAVCARLRAGGAPVVVLDGDAVRVLLGAAGRHFDATSRRDLALTYARIAAWLAGQGVVVVAAVVALFDEARAANRANGLPYLEVWLRAPDALRRIRAADREAEGPRVGVELAPEWPRNAHLVLDNDDRPSTIDELAGQVVATWRAMRDAGA